MAEENKEILQEYFGVINTPLDSHLLGNLEVWVYNCDREEHTPHCHVKLRDDSLEFEVSILTWQPFRLRKPEEKNLNGWDEISSDIRKTFFKWLNRNSSGRGLESLTNKEATLINWDQNNPNNRLEKWVTKDNVNIDKDVREFIYPTINLTKLSKQVIGELTQIYFVNPTERERLHKLLLQELLNTLNINIDLKGNDEAAEIVQTAENNVYIWSMPR